MPRRLSSPLSYGLRVAPASSSVTEARRRVLELVRQWRTGMTSDQIEELSLLTSEVVTNAVSGSGATCAVCVRWTGVKVRVEVTDPNPQLPHVVSPASESENGRGLWLVTALATSWGAKQSQPEKWSGSRLQSRVRPPERLLRPTSLKRLAVASDLRLPRADAEASAALTWQRGAGHPLNPLREEGRST
ncbi:ATP-binding protein [Streptomyces tubercidicus]